LDKFGHYARFIVAKLKIEIIEEYFDKLFSISFLTCHRGHIEVTDGHADKSGARDFRRVGPDEPIRCFSYAIKPIWGLKWKNSRLTFVSYRRKGLSDSIMFKNNVHFSYFKKFFLRIRNFLFFDRKYVNESLKSAAIYDCAPIENQYHKKNGPKNV